MDPNYSVLYPRYIFGLSADCKGQTVHFIDSNRVVFPAGNSIVVHDVQKNSQTFLHGANKRHAITAITISPSKSLVAVAQYGGEGKDSDALDKPTITVFDITSNKRLKTLSYPVMVAKEYISLAFTTDGQNLVALTGDPEFNIVLWDWMKSHLLCQTRSTGGQGPVYEISTSPTQKNVMCAIGNGAFKFFRYNEGTMTPFGFQQGDSIHFLSHAWFSTGERMLAGTADGRIMLFERGEYRCDIPRIAEKVLKSSHSLLPFYVGHDGQSHIFTNTLFPTRTDISALVTFTNGFAADHGTGNVIIYMKQEKFDKIENEFKKTYVIRIPADTLNSEDKIVCGLAICPMRETIIATTANTQIFKFQISKCHILDDPDLVFDYMSSSFHKGAITSMSVATSRSVFVTAGVDRFIRVWNYITLREEVVKEEYEEIMCITIHPTGHIIAAGLTDKIRLYTVMANTINELRDFHVRGCRVVAFSTGGHYLAAGNEKTVRVFSVMTFEETRTFEGNKTTVRKLKWSVDDTRLVSVSLDGTICEWDIIEGHTIAEYEDKGSRFVDAVLSPDSESVYVVTRAQSMREINLKNKEILAEVNLGYAPTSIVISRSGKLLAAGMEGGFIRSFTRPLAQGNEYFDFHMHGGRVNTIAITFEGGYCISGSHDGSIVVWKVTDSDGRMAQLPKDFTYSDDVLVSLTDMKFRDDEMEDLKDQIHEFEVEMDYKLKRKDMLLHEEIKGIEAMYQAQIHRKYMEIDALKDTISESERKFHEEVAKFEEDDKLTVKNIESFYKTRLIQEFEKYNALQTLIEETITHYEDLMKAKEAKDSVEIGGTAQAMEIELANRNEEWENSNDQSRNSVLEMEEAIRQMEEAVDEEIQYLRKTYDKKLSTVQETNGDLVVSIRMMKKNYAGMRMELEMGREHVHELHVEAQRSKRIVSTTEREAVRLRKDIVDLEVNLLTKEKTIYALKQVNLDLEKTKFILDNTVRELREIVEPRDRQAIFLNHQNLEMAANLETVLAIRNGLELHVHEVAAKLKTRNEEYHLEKRRRARMEILVKRIRAQMSKSMGTLHDKEGLRAAVKEMYEKYGRLPEIGEIEPLEQAALCELIRQLKHLEMSVKSIKEKTIVDKKTARSEQLKMLHENKIRALEIRDLRMELKVVRKEIEKYESKLGIEHTRHGYKALEKVEKRRQVEDALSDKDNLTLEHNKEIERKEEICRAQRDEINKLCEKLAEVELEYNN